ncbi:Sulfotransferase protein, putative [Shewanella piezotolerans WP3]|uniref:Sulfotransferase protein, putative n=1 Tax=Shewanella piezotolerans (strain WP3 / JCM 13877) TaxID=225849 RepID=B8CL36_SHEPW|nr:hypothetical protein [Shewanella piezotolerans]ACJ28362.1 Sulfotransferase protein, putative [Shewanella piezotolerans WP3]
MNCFYISGYGRSGSTVLDTLLTNFDGLEGIGEATNLFDCIHNNEYCSCGEPILECEYWKPFFKEYNGKINKLAIETRKYEGLRGLFKKSYNSIYDQFWTNYFKSNSNVDIVDSSKISRKTFMRPIIFKRLGVNVTIVHLYKNSDLLLQSLLKGSNKDLNKGVKVEGIPHIFLLRSFVGAFFANLFTCLIGRFFSNGYKFIEYEEIVVDCDTFLVNHFGLNSSLVDLENLNCGHGVSGNRVRKKSKSISLRKSNGNISLTLPIFYKYLFRVLVIFKPSKPIIE